MAQAAGTIGPRLTQLFATAVKAGRRARSETEIGRGAASVPSAAVAMARRHSDALENGVVVVVGAGKVGLLTAKGLRDFGAKRVIVSNRSYDRAVELARTWDGCAVTFEELPRALAEADVVIASTAAPHAVITYQMVEDAIASRPQRALTIVDIAVPRDVEPAVRALPGVRLYDLDDLQELTAEAAADRSGAVPAVQALIDQELESLHVWERRLDVEPTVRALRLWGDGVLEVEVAEALRRLGHLDDRSRGVVTAMATAIAGKLLHPPTVALRAKTGRRDAAAFAATVRELYGLDDARREAVEVRDDAIPLQSANGHHSDGDGSPETGIGSSPAESGA
jgi:glutamyl-tRNA reductase